MSVRFTQSCPTCGRRIQIRASLLGCTVACQHCRAEFVAETGADGSLTGENPATSDLTDPLMARVEEALERARQQTAVS
jgi:hypothetical protein